jgi:Leucine-rich repeat (LRR) protein
MKKILMISLFLLLASGCSLVGAPDNQDIKRNLPTESGATEAGQVTAKSKNNESKKILDLSGQGLTKVSGNVFSQTDLEELNLSDNKLSGALPGEIRHLQGLKVLNVSKNMMTGVPAEIGQLQNLQVLDLSDNQLTGLPNELGNLKKLRILNLSGNKYSQQDLDVILKGLPKEVSIIR